MLRDGVVRLTQEGKAKLTEELSHLTEEKRPSLGKRILDANENGDVSDNSEYEELKEELVMTDARIHELEQTLDRAEIVVPPTDGAIGLGSIVTIESDDGEQETWRLVGPEEADTREGTISTDSPVGHALYGKEVGDSTTVDTPVGTIAYKIRKVS